MPNIEMNDGSNCYEGSRQELDSVDWLRGRVFRLPLLKTFGSIIAITIFFICYFYVMHHPVFTVREMPLTALDRACPVIEWTAWIYFSLWVYISLPMTLMRRVSELGVYLMGGVILSVLGLITFILYPTSVPVWSINWEMYPTLAFIKEMDLTGNACPSLHVGFSVFSAFWGIRILHALKAPPLIAWVYGLWGLFIVASTITTKQHVLWDVVFGIIYGSAAFWLNLKVAGLMHYPRFTVEEEERLDS